MSDYARVDLSAVLGLIHRMTTANIRSEAELKALRDHYSRLAVERMFNTGESFGQASGGALAFLSRPGASDFLAKIADDLPAQVKIVGDLFEQYLDRGEIPAPAYAWRICVILRKQKQTEIERDFLAAWCRHFSLPHAGGTYAKLFDRALKVGAVSTITASRPAG